MTEQWYSARDVAALLGVSKATFYRLRDKLAAESVWRGACLEWTGGVGRHGYGQVYPPRPHNGPILAHRLAFAIATGTLPDGAFILHSCDNRRCVNPAHLRAGTHVENMADMVARGRHRYSQRTHCRRGHELTADNIYATARGGRMCKTCSKAKASEWYYRKTRGAHGAVA